MLRGAPARLADVLDGRVLEQPRDGVESQPVLPGSKSAKLIVRRSVKVRPRAGTGTSMSISVAKLRFRR